MSQILFVTSVFLASRSSSTSSSTSSAYPLIHHAYRARRARSPATRTLHERDYHRRPRSGPPTTTPAAMSIFLDFDGTITAQDTIGELASFALRSHEAGAEAEGTQKAEQKKHEAALETTDLAAAADDDAEPRGSDLSRAWDEVVRAYVADCRAGAAAHHTPPERRTSAAQEIEFLRALKAVEERSLLRVRRCGLFRGLDDDALRAAGRRLVRDDGDGDANVRLRPGFRDFVDRVSGGLGAGAGRWRIYVVSVNWSAKFIEGAIGYRPERPGGGSGIEVLANDIRGVNGAVVGPGILGGADGKDGVGRVLTNSQDKLEVMQAVLRRDEDRGLAVAAGPSVYVGDSNTDLECLLAADRGIVMADGPDSALLETLRRIGRDVPHVREGGAATAGIAWASDFTELLDHVDFGGITR